MPDENLPPQEPPPFGRSDPSDEVPPEAVPVPPPQKGWWSRNCLWVVLATVLIVVLAGVFCCGFGANAIFGIAKKTEAYKMSLDLVKNDPRVAAELGTPIEPGWLAGGGEDDVSGMAEVVYRVSGPTGSGTVAAQAHKQEGVWGLTQVQVQTDEGKSLNLLERPDTMGPIPPELLEQLPEGMEIPPGTPPAGPPEDVPDVPQTPIGPPSDDE